MRHLQGEETPLSSTPVIMPNARLNVGTVTMTVVSMTQLDVTCCTSNECSDDPSRCDRHHDYDNHKVTIGTGKSMA